jgi:putative tryptophan/tyrosine transport system substrate-binding protein
MISDFGMRISNCKRRIKREYGLRSDFGNRAHIKSKKSSDQFPSHFSIDLKSALHNLKAAIVTGAVFFALCAPADAQQPAKIPRLGFLSAASPSAIMARTEAFRQGLRELGYVEGKNIVIEWRSAEGKQDRVPALAAELVRLKVDIIVSGGPIPTRAVKEVTSTTPVVMGFDIDPVGNRFVASLARPGGNITGMSTLAPEISGKQLEILKEIIPKLSHVAVFENSTFPGNAQALRETERAAAALAVNLQHLNVQNSKDFETAFRAAGKGRADAALMLVWGTALDPHRKELVDLAVKNRLPAIYGDREHVEAGGAYDLRRERYRFVSARGYLCRQNSKRRPARRSPRRAAEEVRVHHQSQSSEANWPGDSTERAGASG